MRNCALLIVAVLVALWMIQDHSISQWHNIDIVSAIDGKEYEVLGREENPKQASDILARLNRDNTILINHLESKYRNTLVAKEVEFLSENYDGGAMSEHRPMGTKNTSYVLNKGDVIKLCLRDKETGEFHNYSTLQFVNFHELSHMLDRKWGHNSSFWKCFRFVLQESEEAGIYKPVDYSKHPVPYCGITINSNPYYR